MKCKKLTKNLALLAGTACLTLMVFACPTTSLTVNAASNVQDDSIVTLSGDYGIMPLKDDIQYRYKIENGKMYKRLYNYTVGEWVGDWIYVCDYPG